MWKTAGNNLVSSKGLLYVPSQDATKFKAALKQLNSKQALIF